MKLAVNNFVATSNQRKSWYTARILFQEIAPSQQARARIPNLRVQYIK